MIHSFKTNARQCWSFYFLTVQCFYMEKVIKVKSISDWEAVVLEILLLALPKEEATILTLHGDLGVGKTTLVQTLARQLGVAEVVTSPTFTIMKGYKTNQARGFLHLIHMDAYRIDDLSELAPLRFSEILKAENTIMCIEWAEKIEAALPKNTIDISILQYHEDEREVILRW
jgi:tRNA threonylcarbamoyladenosine biosynthesis protein TsaE